TPGRRGDVGQSARDLPGERANPHPQRPPPCDETDSHSVLRKAMLLPSVGVSKPSPCPIPRRAPTEAAPGREAGASPARPTRPDEKKRLPFESSAAPEQLLDRVVAPEPVAPR